MFSKPQKTPELELNLANQTLVRMEDHVIIRNKLEAATNQIQHLEAEIAKKEALLAEALKANESLQADLQEIDSLTTEIASLTAELEVKEKLYKTLRETNKQLTMQEQESIRIQKEYSALKEEMNRKELEYENKIAMLETAKQLIEQNLTHEQNKHNETKTALETEKKAATEIKDKTAKPLPRLKNDTAMPNDKPFAMQFGSLQNTFFLPWALTPNPFLTPPQPITPRKT